MLGNSLLNGDLYLQAWCQMWPLSHLDMATSWRRFIGAKITLKLLLVSYAGDNRLCNLLPLTTELQITFDGLKIVS